MMKREMADSIPVTWELLCDEHGFSREHYNQLKSTKFHDSLTFDFWFKGCIRIHRR
ncbi:hypothetical protein GL099_07005 [Escherichia coli]|nr:hypothetical protein [Escherichia coli]